MKYLPLLSALLISLQLSAQTLTVKEDAKPIEESAIAEFQSNSKGVLIPRMSSTERENINDPATGLMVFDTTTESFWFYGSNDWESVSDRSYEKFFNYDCDNVENYVLGTDNSSNERCGNVIHNGTAVTGGEEHIFSISGVEDALFTRVTVNNINLVQGDTLYIEHQEEDGCDASTKTIALDRGLFRSFEVSFVAQCDIQIRLRSTQTILIGSPLPGSYDISWDRYQLDDTLMSDITNSFGFFFNPNKQSVGGGVEQNDAWTDAGQSSVLLGSYGNAAGDYATSIGYADDASGEFAAAFGYSNIANNRNATALGNKNRATGDASSAIGRRNDASGVAAVSLGSDNDALGRSSTAVGYDNNANDDFATAVGFSNLADDSSTAVGKSNSALGTQANAVGRLNFATGRSASAFGNSNSASGDVSTTIGFDNRTMALRSNAFGIGMEINVYSMTGIGSFNTLPTGNDQSWVETDPVFAVGNGRDYNFRSTALTILKNGNTGIGTMTPADKLQIKGTLRLESASNSNSYGIRTATDGDIEFVGDGSSVKVIISDGIGRMGIGTQSPNQLLSVNGNASKTGGGSWATFSDRRLKKDIKPFTDGLEQVLKIDPITYRYNSKAGIETKDLQIGVIAQDIQKIAPYMVEEADFEKEQEENHMNYLVYNPSALDYLFVNAFKEQQAIIEEKEEQIERLETRLGKVEQLLQQLIQKEENLPDISNKNNAQLFQNQPNPFNNRTSIPYFLPETVNKARLQITTAQGQVWKVIEIAGRGEGQIELEVPATNVGSYVYSLVIDGRVVATHIMMLTK